MFFNLYFTCSPTNIFRKNHAAFGCGILAVVQPGGLRGLQPPTAKSHENFDSNAGVLTCFRLEQYV